jgi:mRNA interferase RelE/StbE
MDFDYWKQKMIHTIEFKPTAIKDLRGFPRSQVDRILKKIATLRNGMIGDVKKLTSHTPEYRLRVGDYRILFEIEGDRMVIYRIKHRKDAYI